MHAVKDWFVVRKSGVPKTSRLICIPNAGAGVFAFRGWPEALADVEVAVAHLPGRDARRGEQLPESLRDIAAALASAASQLPLLPTLIFGHSMGALIAYELARELTAQGSPPVGLIASGRRAPSATGRFPNVSHLPDVAFLEAIQQRYGGIPIEVIENEELRGMFLSTLRADMRLVEAYAPAAGSGLICPVVAYGGDQDPQTSLDELDLWRSETSGPFARRVFAGGHFFVDSARDSVLTAVRSDLARTLRDRAHANIRR